MRRSIEMKLLYIKIKWHWLCIAWDRRTGKILLAAGLPLSSPYLNKISRQLSDRCARVMRAKKRYEELEDVEFT